MDFFDKALQDIQNDGGAHIVAFPEYAIYGAVFSLMSRETMSQFLEHIPNMIFPLSYKIIPCSDPAFSDRPVLQSLSCLAKKYKIVLVANIGDIQPCSGEQCRSDGSYYFNTNVVFEADGELIAKYHKINLYGIEAKLFDSGSHSNYTCVSFETSFGVTFATFTCYDLLFREPASCLLNKNIKNFVLPTEWGSSYPFYISTAIQQGWSRKHGVNLLAANQHFANTFSTGSGIYSSGVARHYIMNGEAEIPANGHVITADLSQDGYTAQGDKVLLSVGGIKSKGNTYLNFELIPLHCDTTTNSSAECKNANFNGAKPLLLGKGDKSMIKVEHHNDELNLDLTCNLEYSIKSSLLVQEQYALGAYIGSSKSNKEFVFAVCTLVKCPSFDKCGEPVVGYKTDTIFDKVVLSGTFADGSNVYVTAFGNNLKLLEPNKMVIEPNTVTIIGNNQPLLAASLWTRVYN